MRLIALVEATALGSLEDYESYLNTPFRAYRFRKPKDYVPRKEMPVDVLSKAVKYHAQNFGGERWPALEKAFLMRKDTYQGHRGDMLRPRMSIFKYLNNIQEPWPEGEQLVQTLFDKLSMLVDSSGYSRYIDIVNPNMIEYLIRKKIKVQHLLQVIEPYIKAEREIERSLQKSIELAELGDVLDDKDIFGDQTLDQRFGDEKARLLRQYYNAVMPSGGI